MFIELSLAVKAAHSRRLLKPYAQVHPHVKYCFSSTNWTILQVETLVRRVSQGHLLAHTEGHPRGNARSSVSISNSHNCAAKCFGTAR